MCGRFALTSSSQKLARDFDLSELPAWSPRFNIAPSETILTIAPEPQGQRLAVSRRWGLIPYWAKDAKISARLINARAETLASKPAFRDAFRRRRCLIPADGFYEWRKQGRRRQPFFIRSAESEPLAFAGLYERWKTPEHDWLESCTIVTSEANSTLASIHDRMPVILGREAFDPWLDPQLEDAAALQALLQPAPDNLLEAYAVSEHVNHPENDDAACIEPIFHELQ